MALDHFAFGTSAGERGSRRIDLAGLGIVCDMGAQFSAMRRCDGATTAGDKPFMARKLIGRSGNELGAGCRRLCKLLACIVRSVAGQCQRLFGDVRVAHRACELTAAN